jgi:hypothetical protein
LGLGCFPNADAKLRIFFKSPKISQDIFAKNHHFARLMPPHIIYITAPTNIFPNYCRFLNRFTTFASLTGHETSRLDL